MRNSCSSGAGNSPAFESRLARPCTSRFDQQVGKRGGEVLARHQFDGGADQVEVVGREIFADVERAHRQLQLVEVGIAPRVGIGLLEIEQPHLRRGQQLADDSRGGGVAHQEHSVEFARDQGVRGVGAGEVGYLHRIGALVDAVGGEQGEGEGAGAAAFRADRQVLGAQFGQPVDLQLAAIEHQQRHMEQAAQRHQPVLRHAAGDTALHQADIDAEFRIVETLQVFQRTLRTQNVEFDAVVRQDLGVFVGGAAKTAAVGSGGDGQAVRRPRVDQENRGDQHGCAGEHQRPHRYREITPRDADHAAAKLMKGAAQVGGFGRHGVGDWTLHRAPKVPGIRPAAILSSGNRGVRL